MASRSAPYATSNDQPTPPRSSSSRSASSVAPWEKDQSPKMQSKGGESRRANSNVTMPRTTELAPFGTADNLRSTPSPKAMGKSVSESAPFGTSGNVPVQRADRHQAGVLTPFGTTVEKKKPAPKSPSASTESAPWTRDESKYTHRGKASNPQSFIAPYATQSK